MMVSHGQKVYGDDVHGHVTPVYDSHATPGLSNINMPSKTLLINRHFHESNEGDYTAQLCGDNNKHQ